MSETGVWYCYECGHEMADDGQPCPHEAGAEPYLGHECDCEGPEHGGGRGVVTPRGAGVDALLSFGVGLLYGSFVAEAWLRAGPPPWRVRAAGVTGLLAFAAMLVSIVAVLVGGVWHLVRWALL